MFWDVRFINNTVDNYFVKKQVQKMTLNMPLSQAERKRRWILSTEHERKACGYSTDVESWELANILNSTR